MPLTFPILISHVNGHYEAETPALPGWSAAAAAVEPLLGHARAALEGALPRMDPPFDYPTTARHGIQVYQVIMEEPFSWFEKPPNE